MSDVTATDDCVYRFVWVEETDAALGGQWMAFPPDGLPWPVALADACEATRSGEVTEPDGEDPLGVHVAAARDIIAAAGELEDRLFPDSRTRLQVALAAVDRDEPEVDPSSEEGEEVRKAAEALEKVAADLAELVEEQLGETGSLATLPPNSTAALCQAVQAAWRLRRLVDPPSPLYL